MSNKNSAIYAAILALVPDLPELKPGDYRRFSATGYMDLHLDALEVRQDNGEKQLLIALAHNYRHPSGDIIPDPDVEIRIYPDRSFAEALSYQDIYTYRMVTEESGAVDDREQKAQNDFLLIWLANIKNQGHVLVERKGNED